MENFNLEAALNRLRCHYLECDGNIQNLVRQGILSLLSKKADKAEIKSTITSLVQLLDPTKSEV